MRSVLCRRRFDSPIFAALNETGPSPCDGHPRDVPQLISTVSMCTRTSGKERAASCVRALSRTDEIKRARMRYFGRRKIIGYEMAGALIILCGGYSLNERGKSTENDVRFDYACVTPVGHFINRTMSRHCRIC